jgi:hypothetical protein
VHHARVTVRKLGSDYLQLACGALGGRGMLCRMFRRASGSMRPT